MLRRIRNWIGARQAFGCIFFLLGYVMVTSIRKYINTCNVECLKNLIRQVIK